MLQHKLHLHHANIHRGPKNRLHFLKIDCSLYKRWPKCIIFGTHYTEGICNTTITDKSTSPTYCCCTTLGNQFVVLEPLWPICSIKTPLSRVPNSALGHKISSVSGEWKRNFILVPVSIGGIATIQCSFSARHLRSPGRCGPIAIQALFLLL